MQVFATRLGVVDVPGHVVLWLGLYPNPIGAFYLQTIDPDILDVVVLPVVGIAADDARFVEEEARIAAVEAK